MRERCLDDRAGQNVDVYIDEEDPQPGTSISTKAKSRIRRADDGQVPGATVANISIQNIITISIILGPIPGGFAFTMKPHFY